MNGNGPTEPQLQVVITGGWCVAKKKVHTEDTTSHGEKKKGKKKEVPGSYYVLYEHQRRRQLAARGHCHSSTAISARRPAAEVKLLLRVYLTRQVVGHRVAQATALPSEGGAEAPFGVVAVADQVL